MHAAQPRTAQLEGVTCIALGCLALSVGAVNGGFGRLALIAGSLWLIAGVWILNSTRDWRDRNAQHQTRTIILAHGCTFLLLGLYFLVSTPGGASGEELIFPADPDSPGMASHGDGNRSKVDEES